MQNIQKLYQDLHEGKITKNQFLFQIRKDSRINSYFTPANSYEETVRILKNKGLLLEVKSVVKEEIDLQEPKMDPEGKWVSKDTFDDYSVNDRVSLDKDPSKVGIIGRIFIDMNTGERIAVIKFDDGTVKRVHITDLGDVVGSFRQDESIEEGEDHEVSMAQNQIDAIIKAATELKDKIGSEEKDIPAWIQDHITNSENYISQAASNYHEYKGEEDGQEEMGSEDEMQMHEAKKTLWWVMIEKDGKRYYLKNSPHFSSEEEAHEYAKQHNVKNYSLKSREEEVDDQGRLNEARAAQKGIDQVNPYEYKKGVYYELDCQKEGSKDTKKAIKTVLKNLNKNSNYYTDLFAGEDDEKMDFTKMKEAIPANFVDKENGMKEIKESIKSLINQILSE